MAHRDEKRPSEALEASHQGNAAEENSAGAAPESEAAQDATPQAAAPAETETEKLKGEKAELYDRLLRKQAELDNFRKRTQREKEEFVQHATAELIRALLPVLDGFDRALEHRSTSTPEQFIQGMEMIHRELLETLNRAGVSIIATAGERFDPHFHQAVETVESAEHRDQEIVEELQRGYRLRNRLLRPAIVKVAVAKKK
jgi:molecular chaperone GrpE